MQKYFRQGIRVTFALSSLASIVSMPIATAGTAADSPTALFTPSFLVNEDPICSGVSQAIQSEFIAGDSWDSLAAGIATDDGSLEALEIETAGSNEADDTDQLAALPRDIQLGPKPVSFVTISGTKVFVRLETGEFCGGACEAQRASVSSTPDRSGADTTSPTDSQSDTPFGPSWSLLKDRHGNFYIVGMQDGHALAYRIVVPNKLHLACEIVATPDEAAALGNLAVHATAASLHEFKLAVTDVTGETNGDCGSERTPARWARAVDDALLQIIYRPLSDEWQPRKAELSSDNSFGDYDRNIQNLETWALTGVHEYRAFDHYRTQFTATAHQLATFYGREFHLPESQAEQLAERNLRAAVSRGIGFYRYEPPFNSDAERRFRKGVFDHLSRRQLESLAADAWPDGLSSAQEDVLALAVSYPDALRVLLERGADPNVSNGFGKTPLMYAAQLNMLQSVELLLEHGANPNAATAWPDDRCFYQLTTIKVTPLHYAVRYGSNSLVRALVSKGASTSARTESVVDNGNGYPLDWLLRYTGPTAAERNPNIALAEIPELQLLLRVPNKHQDARQ